MRANLKNDPKYRASIGVDQTKKKDVIDEIKEKNSKDQGSVLDTIKDFAQEHTLWVVIGGAILLLLILILVLSVASPKLQPVAGNPEALYPYTLSLSKDGVVLNIRGKFPKGYTWVGSSPDGDVITMSETKQSGKRASFLIAPLQSGTAAVTFYLQKDFLPEMTDRKYEIKFGVTFRDDGSVFAGGESDRQMRGLVGEDTENFSYRIGEEPDGTLLVWVKNGTDSTWKASTSDRAVKLSEYYDHIVRFSSDLSEVSDEEWAAKLEADAAMGATKTYDENGEEILLNEEAQQRKMKQEEEIQAGIIGDALGDESEVSTDAVLEEYFYTVSFRGQGTGTVYVDNEAYDTGFALTVFAGSDESLTLTEWHILGQKKLLDAEGNPILDEEGNPIYLSESRDQKTSDYDLTGTQQYVDIMGENSIPDSLLAYPYQTVYFDSRDLSEDNLGYPMEATWISYEDGSGVTWNYYQSLGLTGLDYVGDAKIAKSATKSGVQIKAYKGEYGVRVIWSYNFINYLLETEDTEISADSAIAVATALVEELVSQE